jgi:hypothetical protein
VGDNGGMDARSCADGEFERGSPYGGVVPATRSGLMAKGFHGGDMPSLEGDGGSMWTACSLSRASLAVLWNEYACGRNSDDAVAERGRNAAGACGTAWDDLQVNKTNNRRTFRVATGLANHSAEPNTTARPHHDHHFFPFC